ncbi:MAG: UvrB/UvrC motif-containing protein [Candidatus Magasanikbacteria bacterium]|nr:UvrB/UvrC motif-containing protein [Candidatus Magasanikbacteria bacterium]
MEKHLIRRLKKLPDAPGVYFFHNRQKELVYVGKASSLRDRVGSYFRGARTPRPIEIMIHEVADVRWRETDSVLEAVILEADCIKRQQPKYNVDGKDDKSWNYLVITKDTYPRLAPIRQHDFDLLNKQDPQALKKYLYIFGPYPGVNITALQKILRRLFHFSTCLSGQKRPCLYYEMKQCPGVCVGEISPSGYKEYVIRPLVTFLRGRKKYLINRLESEMKRLSRTQAYEDAARLRDQLRQLHKIQDVALLNRSFVESLRAERPTGGYHRVEAYDISNLGSTGAVGSMAVFVDGQPLKSGYRKFKIRTVIGQSDVDCLAEVCERRLRHTEWAYPELVLVDGGRPQISRVKKVFDACHISVPIIGMQKGPKRKRTDIIFADNPTRNLITWVHRHQPALVRLRDEAHRFAITYQRQLRRLPRARGTVAASRRRLRAGG